MNKFPCYSSSHFLFYQILFPEKTTHPPRAHNVRYENNFNEYYRPFYLDTPIAHPVVFTIRRKNHQTLPFMALSVLREFWKQGF